MPSFEYQSLKKHLESRGRFLGAVANHILRTAQDNAVDGELDITAEDIPYEYDFLQDRELLAEMLAERPEIAFVEAHNNGFSLRLREPVQEMTAGDIRIHDALLIEDDHVNACLGIQFDAGRRFGLPALGGDDSVNLYADYYPMNERLEVCCIIKYADGTDSEPVALRDMTGSEKEMLLEHMREAGLEDCLAEMGLRPAQVNLEAIYAMHYNFLNNLPGGQCADFSGMLLSGLVMRHMDFSYANFSGAAVNGCDMEHGRFEGCIFTGTHFYGVQAGNASLELSDLTGAHLEGSNFRCANFENSDCSGTVFEHVNLDQANMDLCAFHRAKFIYTSLDSASTILSRGLTINRPDSKAQVFLEIMHARHTLWRCGDRGGEQADFRDNSLEKLDFSGKNFDQALFQNAELSRCELAGCSLDSAVFDGAAIEACGFAGAFLQDASFAGAQIHGCDFTEAELDGADFYQARITNCEGLEDISSGQGMKMGGGMQ